ncbi:MAG: nuclease-related domain-containing protein [Ignavibacteria bacterium]|nr:nuclease-related domain-containing protein [Ignavibacteria bacterium]
MEVKSPLRQKPLPNPGDSVDAKIQELIDDRMLTWLLASLLAVFLAFMEWLRVYLPREPSPWLFSSFAVIVIATSVFRIRKFREKLKFLRQGRDGEIAVGQFLERCREQGAKLFHDIPGDGFNLDHVIIHTSGIYVIETKTISKPISGRAELIFNGSTIRCEGKFTTDKPLIQVQAARHWLSSLLGESTGRRILKSSIRPVVVYPGWYITPTAEAKLSDVWVLNPKALPEFISNSRTQLTVDEVHMYALHLSKYIRTTK